MIRTMGTTLAALVVLFALLSPALTPAPTNAEEGMWLLNDLDKAPFETWRKNGLMLDKKQLYDPKGPDLSDAVVQIGGGTGSFVSSQGLVATNHHVAFGALQRQSSVEINYIEDGFLAKTMAEEIPALGYNAYVVKDIKDVTKDVLKKVKDDMTDLERHEAIEMAQKKIIKKAEKGKDVEAEVKSVYGGSQYYLYTRLKIKDVRIVYAPPASIGVYGGDIDNWMWPRHTGDFSFLRAYVGPDGKSAEYAENNVPYEPEKYLAFSTSPLEDGELTMVIGYPGSTRRYRTSYSIDYSMNTYYPRAIERYRELLDVYEEEAASNPDAEILLASNIQGLNNGYKNNQGMLEGLLKADLIDKKLDEEKALRDYISANPEMDAYATLFEDIGKQYDSYMEVADRYSTLRWMQYLTSALRSSYTVYKWNLEQTKDDLDRDEGYMQRDEPRLQKGLELANLRYYEAADKRVLKYFLIKSASRPEREQLHVLKDICADCSGDEMVVAINQFVDDLYAGTKITDKETRMEMFAMGEKKLMKMNDPMIEFAAKLEAENEEIEQRTDAFEGALSKLRPKVMEIRAAYSGGALYPDANFSMRLSVGKTAGYSPADAINYTYMTCLDGVIQKNTGEEPFNVPEKLAKLAADSDYGPYADPKLDDVPVCFLSTNDATGGNSGSAVLNGKGEIIGLLFDGNYEAIAADYFFMPKLTRSISVDSRYILFIMDKFTDADNLLEEMGISKRVGLR